MAGISSKFKRGGGGYLNGVDGVIRSLTFTTEPDFGKGAQASSGDKVMLWGVLTLQQDSEEGEETTHLFAGDSEGFVISEDGKTLTPTSDDVQLWGDTALMQFYESMVANDFEDIEVGADGSLDFSGVENQRVRFVQVKDEKLMERSAKTHLKSKGKINELGQKRGSDGKFYDQRTLQVSAVYGPAEEAPKAPAKKKTIAARPTEAKAPSKKTSPSPSTTQKTVVKDDGDSDLAVFAESALIDVLRAARDNKITKKDLNVAVTRKLVKDDRREAVRLYLQDDSNLKAICSENDAITFDGKGLLTLSA